MFLIWKVALNILDTVIDYKLPIELCFDVPKMKYSKTGKKAM